ncbi:signal peptidase I [Actinoplanes sp. NPDC051861]|uniref:signal peptidase I n=1 Tax=Actinoplanes sp. NPDC051861 TaxID=3155170 RepID=UPI003411F959
MAAILVMAAIGAWAVNTGRLSYVVTQGKSMQPVYYAGDLVLITKPDMYQQGDIAAYHGAGGQMEVLHRIIGGNAETGFVFQGDNNKDADPDKVAVDQLIGRAALHIPKVGTVLQPVLSPTGLGMIGFLFVSGGTAVAKTRRDIPRGRRKKKVKGMSGQGGSMAMATAIFKAVSRLHPALRVLAYATVVAGVLGLALGVLGYMKPATETVRGSGKAGEAMTFSYSADVPLSPAYDGTTVYSPDPVFRKLASVVKLQMSYQGEPGRIEVNARLSAQNGWHTTVNLSQPKQFTSQRYLDAVLLDLDTLEKRAIDAGKAIGADMGAITLAITTRIEHNDGTAFEPQIALNLAPLQLTLASGPESLLVDQSSGATGSRVQDRQIGAFGYDVVTASQARKYAVYLLLVAIGGAVVIAMMALRHVPLRTRAQIERRYPHLIVPVEPMASPPGKPVVLVDTFPALVKLAERYGQMILTWTRPDGSDDFIVRDEGITYRYRIQPSITEPDAPPIIAEPTPAAPPRTPRSRKATPVEGPAPAAALPAAPESPSPELAAQEPPVQEPPVQEPAAQEPAAQEPPAQEAIEPLPTEAQIIEAEQAESEKTETKEKSEKAEKPETGDKPDTEEPIAAQEKTEESPEAQKQPTESAPTKAPAKRSRRPRPKPTVPAEPVATPEPSADSAPVTDTPTPAKRTPRRKPSPRKAAKPKATPPPEQPDPQQREPKQPEPKQPEPKQPEPTTDPDDTALTTVAEIERKAVEDLAQLNKPIPEPEPKREPFYDFLPPSKRPTP